MLSVWGSKAKLRRVSITARMAMLLLGIILLYFSFQDVKQWAWLMPSGAYLVNMSAFIGQRWLSSLRGESRGLKSRKWMMAWLMVLLLAAFSYYVYVGVYLDGRFSWQEKLVFLCLWGGIWFLDMVLELRSINAKEATTSTAG